MNVFMGLFGSAGLDGAAALPSSGELGVAVLALIVLDALYLAWLKGRSKRRADRSLVDGAQRLAHKGRSAQPRVALRFR